MEIIRARAPLRLGFGGGGTDIPPFPEQEGGIVLNATIGRYVYGSLRPRDDGEIHIDSPNIGASVILTGGEPINFEGLLGLEEAAIRRLRPEGSHGFDMYLHGQVESGSGLGSSSASVVAMVGLFKEWLGLPMGNYEVADLACVIEREDLGISGGMQDQYAASFGGFNLIEFYGDHVIVNPIRLNSDTLNELELNLLLAFTGITRKSGNVISDQIKRVNEGVDEAMSALRGLKDITIQMKNALLRHQPDYFGELLHEEWMHKRKFSDKVSTPQIDEIYESVRKAGVIGGKISGAGGGGYMMLYCPHEKRHIISKMLVNLGCRPTDVVFESGGLQTWRTTSA